MQALYPLGKLLPEQGEGDPLRLLPVALIALHQGSDDDHQQDQGDPQPIAAQPAFILL